MSQCHAVTFYDPDSQFTMSALYRLVGVGITVIASLNSSSIFFQQVLSVFIPHLSAFHDASSLLNAWVLSDVVHRLPPTWRNLFLIVRLLNLHELAQRMETYLSAGATGVIESEGK